VNPNSTEDVRREAWSSLIARLAADVDTVGRPAESNRAARTASAAAETRLRSQAERKDRAENELRVAGAALAHPRLGLLFPFTSLNRLCFSRCSRYPFTNDCPCIVVGGSLEPYVVCRKPYEPGLRPGVVVGETTSLDEALEIAAAALPLTAAHVWLGSNSRPKG
jgi:hypothetical protein